MCGGSGAVGGPGTSRGCGCCRPLGHGTTPDRPRRFEYHAIAAAARVAKRGIFIVPRPSIHETYPRQRTTDCLRFTQETGIELETTWMNADAWRDQWGGPTPSVSVVCAEFQHLHPRIVH
ncbi:hypothetical protein ACWEAF_30925 [Streptomyces sp. NPDC005071]